MTVFIVLLVRGALQLKVQVEICPDGVGGKKWQPRKPHFTTRSSWNCLTEASIWLSFSQTLPSIPSVGLGWRINRKIQISHQGWFLNFIKRKLGFLNDTVESRINDTVESRILLIRWSLEKGLWYREYQ